MSGRIRAVVVVPSAARRGGGDVWLAQLLATLSPGQIDLLAIFETPGELVGDARAAGHRAAVLDVHGDDLERFSAPLAHVLDREHPDVTVHWSPRAHVYAAPARQMVGMGDGPATWVQHVISSRFWLHELANDLPADAVACVSSAVALANRRLHPERRTVLLHPGVDPGSERVGRAVARRALGVPLEEFVIGVVGRVEPWKGQDIAVRALALLRQAGLAVHCLFVGDDRSPSWPEFAGVVRVLVAELGLSPHVTFTGHLPTTSAPLAAIDALVCASREEGFGLAVVESMASTVPVVATRCGGPEDILTDGLDGLLVRAEDHTALATAVVALVEDRSLAARIAIAGRRTWSRRFTARLGAERFLALVQELAGQPERSHSRS